MKISIRNDGQELIAVDSATGERLDDVAGIAVEYRHGGVARCVIEFVDTAVRVEAVEADEIRPGDEDVVEDAPDAP